MLSTAAVLHLLPYLASAATSAGVGAYCWARRSRPGVGAFAVMAFGQAAWTLGFVFELAAPGLRGKLFWDNVQFLPLPAIPVAFLAFAHGYAGRRLRRAPAVYALLAAPLVALAVLAFTDPLHGLVRVSPRLVPGDPFAGLTYGFTPLITAALLYVYLVYVAAFAELTAAWVRAHPLYRAQVAILAAGAAIPLLGTVLTMTVLADAPGRDLTPITFAVSQVVIAWGLFRRRLFDVVPVARHAVVESLADAVYVVDAQGRVVDLNPAARRAAGGSGVEPVGRAGADVLPLTPEIVRRLADTHGEHVEVETTGGGGAAELGVHPVSGPRGESWGSVVVLRDIRERKRAEQELRGHRDRLEELVGERTAALRAEMAARTEADAALRDSEERLRQIAENGSELFWLMEADGRAAYLSPAFDAMWGIDRARVYADPEVALAAVPAEEREGVRAMWAEAFGGCAAEATHRVSRPDGSEIWIQTRAVPVHDAAGAVYRVAGVSQDVTERRRMEHQLLHDAFHDGLTGLPNRALFQDRLRQALDLFHRHPDRGFAVMVLDLDRFKRVNDSFGHQAGDRLLAAVAERLRAGMRDGDTVARFGGDEFALLLDGVPDAGEALRAAGQLQAALAAPFALEGHELFVTASLGIALSDPGTEGPDALVRKADTALYRAKELGGGQCEVFDRAMHARALARLRLETELRRAAEREEFLAVYQPIVALDDGRVAGFEALVRWRHPVRGVLAPGSFLDVAEETGLVVHIDRWVLREACLQLRRWRDLHPGLELRMTVNVSARQFAQGGLVEHLEATLAETGVDVDWIRLEITEGVLVGRAEEAVLAELRARGVHLLIDDFGTGHSSLGYLHRLPITALKVDRSFMSGSAGNFAIVGAVVTLAHHLGMDVVVEGVERPEQLERVRGFAADYAQGYLFSRPLEAAAAESLLLRRWTGDGWSPPLPDA
jgi:diguanylate cyclase (GGDEF)-like protein/PAS domain S-box-containing protein